MGKSLSSDSRKSAFGEAKEASRSAAPDARERIQERIPTGAEEDTIRKRRILERYIVRLDIQIRVARFRT